MPRTRSERAAARRKLAEELRGVICDITDASWDEVCRRRRGPGGNPKLRFAAWALATHTDMTHHQTGKLLSINAKHVALLRSRAYDERSGKVIDWMTRFELWKRANDK